MRLAYAVIAVALWSVGPAFAADAHKIDFTTVMTNADDQPIMECTDPLNIDPANAACKAKRAVTLGMIAERALVSGETGITPEDSLMRGQLGLSVLHSSGATLTAEEVALIKKRIAAIYGPLIVARAFPLLDPAAVK